MRRGLTAFPYFGSKALVADALWDAFGHDVANYIEPFCGSCAVLLSRPTPGKIETVNDAHAFLPNFFRAVKHDPEAVAEAATWPVSEVDMHARHAALIERFDEAMIERLRDDAEHFDAEAAGWWVWGASIWIGSGWCAPVHRNSHAAQRPHLAGGKPASPGRRPQLQGREGTTHPGQGIFRNRLPRQIPHLDRDTRGGTSDTAGRGIFKKRLPHLIGPHNGRKEDGNGEGVGHGRGIFASGRREDLLGYFQWLSDRFARVRITCGDWTRVVTPAVTISHGTTAILLDPPYAGDRVANLYAQDSKTISADVRAWAIEHGENPAYRIALCGYEDEHDMPSSWRVHAWKANGGYSNRSDNENATKERVWFSPWCLGGERVWGPLFARGAP